jgi:uncharacterized membrane-anchored protein
MTPRVVILAIFTPVLFTYLNALNVQKEKILDDGQVVLLELAPVDPRSLMQGDYMVLNYKISREQRNVAQKLENRRGRLVLKLDENNIGTFVRFDDGTALEADQVYLRFRYHRGLKLGAESFFFQEGMAREFEGARFGELRVAPSGEAILTGLRGPKREVLGEAQSAGDQ